MNYLKCLTLLILLCFSSTLLPAQAPRKSVYVEIGGPTLWGYSLNFEHRLVTISPGFQVRGGIGIGTALHVHEEYESRRIALIPKIEGLVGKRKHHFVFGINHVFPFEEQMLVRGHVGYRFHSQRGLRLGVDLYSVTIVDNLFPYPGLNLGYGF